MKFDNQLRYAVNIIQQYHGDIPLAAWLKNFFRENKQMGSKDRKTVSSLVYAYYRAGHVLKQVPVAEGVLAAFYLSTSAPAELLSWLKPFYNNTIQQSLAEKISYVHAELNISFQPGDLFPWRWALSADIDADAFCLSFLTQPDVFLRIRPGKQETVIRKFRHAQVDFSIINDHCISLPAGIKIDEVIALNSDAVVQDYNSQQVATMFGPAIGTQNHHEDGKKRLPIYVWDSCAASGGKSLMAYDINPAIHLTVSDVRPSILHNLQKRFAEAGIKKYAAHVVDLTDAAQITFREQSFDLIIADLPCSGSGTWSRTPEQLFFFKEEKITWYSNLQKQILKQLFRYLKPGGSLVYSTCSVFKKENEEVVEFIKSEGRLHCDDMQLFKGYNRKADTLFAARFTG